MHWRGATPDVAITARPSADVLEPQHRLLTAAAFACRARAAAAINPQLADRWVLAKQRRNELGCLLCGGTESWSANR
jgi:hypothetical protein